MKVYTLPLIRGGLSHPEPFLYSRFSSNRPDTAEARFLARVMCAEILSELLGRPTGLRENALVSWHDAIGTTKKAFALKECTLYATLEHAQRH